MKKYILLLVSSLFLLISCNEDEFLRPRAELIPGAYVRLDITSKRINIAQPNESFFGGIISTPGNNVAKYNLYVRKTDIFGVAGSFVPFKTFTTFPADLKVYTSDLASALGISNSDIVFGDNFRFYGESFDQNNVRSDYFSISSVIQSAPSMKQGYRFVTDITDASGVTQSELDAFDNYISQ
jgi:hypothetical protein